MVMPLHTLPDGRKVRFSYHAIERMADMGLQPHQIDLILASPEDTWESTKYPGGVCYKRGEHALATQVDDAGVEVVVTALYSRLTHWKEADKRGELTGDRVLRLDTGIPE